MASQNYALSECSADCMALIAFPSALGRTTRQERY